MGIDTEPAEAENVRHLWAVTTATPESAHGWEIYWGDITEQTPDQRIAWRSTDGATNVIQRRPLGVLLGIMPWNYPYYQVARFAAPLCEKNLAALQKL